jgi:hypothetical protein
MSRMSDASGMCGNNLHIFDNANRKIRDCLIALK